MKQPANVSASMVNTGFNQGQVMIDVVSCAQVIIGSSGSVNIDYSKGGRAAVLVPEYYLRGSNICKTAQAQSFQNETGPGSGTRAVVSGAVPRSRQLGLGWAAMVIGGLVLGGFLAL